MRRCEQTGQLSWQCSANVQYDAMPGTRTMPHVQCVSEHRIWPQASLYFSPPHMHIVCVHQFKFEQKLVLSLYLSLNVRYGEMRCFLFSTFKNKYYDTPSRRLTSTPPKTDLAPMHSAHTSSEEDLLPHNRPQRLEPQIPVILGVYFIHQVFKTWIISHSSLNMVNLTCFSQMSLKNGDIWEKRGDKWDWQGTFETNQSISNVPILTKRYIWDWGVNLKCPPIGAQPPKCVGDKWDWRFISNVPPLVSSLLKVSGTYEIDS